MITDYTLFKCNNSAAIILGNNILYNYILCVVKCIEVSLSVRECKLSSAHVLRPRLHSNQCQVVSPSNNNLANILSKRHTTYKPIH